MSVPRRARRDRGVPSTCSNQRLSPREMRRATKQIARIEKGAAHESSVHGEYQARNAEEGSTTTLRVMTEDDGSTGEVCDLSRVVGYLSWQAECGVHCMYCPRINNVMDILSTASQYLMPYTSVSKDIR